MLGQTTSQISGKTKGEKLNLILQTNQSDHSDLLGATVTISFLGGEESYVWDGNRIVVEIPGMLQYTVTVSDVPNYKTPDPVTYTAIEGNTVSVTMTYQCELLTVNVSADEGSVSGYEVQILKEDVVGVSTKYTRLEYIEFTGTQYIDTGFSVNQNTQLIMKIKSCTSSNNYPFGSQESDSNGNLKLFWVSNNQIGWGNQTSTTELFDLNNNLTCDINFNKGSLEINGSTVWTPSQEIFQSGLNLYLGKINNTYNSIDFVFVGLVYSCQVYDNGVLIRDYIPALRYDGIAGLYDSVNDTFYTSNSDKNCIAGNKYLKTIFTQTSSHESYKIPFDMSYTIKSSKLDGYSTPEVITRVSSLSSYVADIQYKIITVKDLSMYDIYGNETNQNTANCYIIDKVGTYKFPLVYGNAIKNGSTNSEAYTNTVGGAGFADFVDHRGVEITSPYIEIQSYSGNMAQLSITDTEDVFDNINIVNGENCRYIQFEIKSIPNTGANGIISVCYNDMIMWSWHIWVWPYDLNPVEITNATEVKYNIMPVNLASKYDSDLVHIKNWFYQFGRPTPLLCPSTYNSDTDHASYGTLNFAIVSTAENIQMGIKNPTTFYTYGGTYSNWYSSGAGDVYNLWDAACTETGASDNDTVKTIYDPCPVGWKIPNGNTFTGLSIISSENSIIKMKRYSSDRIGVEFSLSGYRSGINGSLSYVGSDGYVWLSSAKSQSDAYILFFTDEGVNTKGSSGRSFGFSVRPVQE